MKCLGRVLACTVALVAIMGTCFVFVPNRASATEYAGTSPSFATGQTWSLDVGWANAGDMITWDWGSSDSLIFSFWRLPNTYYGGLTDYDGIVVDTSGEYVMRWYNNNLIFSATVDFWVASFTPSFSVSSPSEGAYVNSKTISVQGTTDAYSTGVLVGPDAMHLKEADWSMNDWGVDGLVLNEGQNSILVRCYYILDYDGFKNITYDKTIHVIVDTVPPELVITEPTNGTCYNCIHGLKWQCSDESGIAKEEVKIDALPWEGGLKLAMPYPLLLEHQLDDGIHTVQVRVTDQAGNQAVQSVTFTADSTPPELAVLSPTAESTVRGNDVVFSWHAQDSNGVSSQVNIDGAGYGDYGGNNENNTYHFKLATGQHTIEVRAFDSAGNNVTKMVTFEVDNRALSFGGPYYGLPLVAIIVGVILVGLFIALTILKRRRAPAAPPLQPPAVPPGAP